MSAPSLTDFLLARIAEDEAAARDAYYDGQAWIPEEEAVVAADRDLDPILYLDRKRDAAHAYRWSPARVLADCEAKRRIVEDEHFDGRSGEHVAPFCSTCSDDEDLVYLPCPTLRLLALPYADHPDYQEDWRPEPSRSTS